MLLAIVAAVTIPFNWTPGQIEVAVKINGTPATFLLDTAAEFSVVSTRLARQLGVVTTRRGGGDFVEGLDMEVGALKFERQRLMVIPFDTYVDRGRQIDGLIGFDFFAAYTVGIDFQQKQLTVAPRQSFSPPEAAVAVPLAFVGRLPVVLAHVTLAGGELVQAKLVVDTGASQSVMFRNPFSRAHRLFDRGGKESVSPSLASGSHRVVDVGVDGVRVGGLTFDHPPAQAYLDWTGAAGSDSTDGLIGNALLSRYRIHVDYANRLLFFEPVKKD